MMSTLTKLIDICFVKPRSSKCSFFKGMLTCYGCPEILGNVHYLGQGVKKFQKIFRGGNFFSLKKNRESFFFSKFLWGGPLIFMKFSVLLAAPCHKQWKFPYMGYIVCIEHLLVCICFINEVFTCLSCLSRVNKKIFIIYGRGQHFFFHKTFKK